MPCPTRFATANDYDSILCAGADLTDPAVVSEIEGALELAAGEISGVMQSVGACDCSYDPWVYFYLAKLNVIIAALDKNCPCSPKISDEERLDYREWVKDQLSKISTGSMELCSGNTGSNYFAFGVAEQNATEWSARDISNNRRLRNSL